jgi:hypothetical protein
MLKVGTAKIYLSRIGRVASSPSWSAWLTEATPAWGNAESAQRSGAKVRTSDRLLAYTNGLWCAGFLSVERPAQETHNCCAGWKTFVAYWLDSAAAIGLFVSLARYGGLVSRERTAHAIFRPRAVRVRV